jgi:hypothetical protein
MITYLLRRAARQQFVDCLDVRHEPDSEEHCVCTFNKTFFRDAIAAGEELDAMSKKTIQILGMRTSLVQVLRRGSGQDERKRMAESRIVLGDGWRRLLAS